MPSIDPDHPRGELEVFEFLIVDHIGGIVRRAREIPADRWNWSFSERTPTAREICEHAFMWLWCDRQEVTAADVSLHRPIPPIPGERLQTIVLLEQEAEAWRSLIHALKPEDLPEEREARDGNRRSVRGYLLHMAGHVLSKSGQMTMLHFDLGLDGDGPYTAPLPNEMPWPSPRR